MGWGNRRKGGALRLVVLLSAGLAPLPALAVWAHRPHCEAESAAAVDRKDDIDKCIANVDDAMGEAPANAKKELPCTAELKALEVAQVNLRHCIESQLLWKQNSKIKK